jgi:hypothetical protein
MASALLGVGHSASLTAPTSVRIGLLWSPRLYWYAFPPDAFVTVGVGHEVDPLSDVRRADARSAQIGGPNGISQRFQVSTNSGEPRPAVSARNLLSKEDCRAALLDETAEDGPEVALVGCPSSTAGAAEWLTWA